MAKLSETQLKRVVERERQKPQNELTQYYINKLEETLEDIQKQIVETESKAK